ncbi:hypothetical protein [Streptomyces armeniacus]|uniref:hypothetical protein n=1 Tax=Streptomyces armeniacus TaxID=83291 RepID=UPI001AD7F946|nr:hypothetical protein [Streptomyces armeniacus]
MSVAMLESREETELAEFDLDVRIEGKDVPIDPMMPWTMTCECEWTELPVCWW